MDPAIPTTEGKEENISVYENTDEENGMLFPIHQACLNLVNRMCETRKSQSQVDNTLKALTLESFCDTFESRRSANVDDTLKIRENRYYGSSGGIERPHQYFGARQFWTDDWDSSPGWEVRWQRRAFESIPLQNKQILIGALVSMRGPCSEPDPPALLLHPFRASPATETCSDAGKQ